MIVKSLEEVQGSIDHVDEENWESRRFVLKKDGVGFSLHDTIIRAGTETTFWYKYHIEAVYCVSGEGELEDHINKKRYQIKDGTMYLLNGHEKHTVRAKTDMRMVCVFNPPCTGRETHDEEGAYPKPEKDPVI